MTSSTRVLILTSSFLPTVGGLQYELKWFLDNLDRHLSGNADIQAHFVYPNASSEQYSRFDNIATYDLRLTDFHKSAIVCMIIRLGKLLRRIRPDIVHCHGVLPDGLWVLAASRMFRVRTRIIVTSHGQDVAWLPQWSYGRRQAKRSRILGRYVAKRISTHVLPSRALLDFVVENGTPRNHIEIIPNGVPIENDYDFEEDSIFYQSAPDASDIGLHQGGGINILSLSSARDIKNLGALIEAFALARRDLGGSKLLLACQGQSAERIIRLVNDKGLKQDVVFIGEITGPNKYAYFWSSDVFCLISHFENFPVSLLEAMKFETAILASRVGGIPEFVEDGKNGLLVSPTNIAEIALSLVRLYRDTKLRNRLVENGLQMVKRYSICRIVDEHIELYNRIVSSKSLSV